MKRFFASIMACAMIIMLASCELRGILKKPDQPQEMAEPAEQKAVANTIAVGIYGLDTFNPLTTKSQTVREALEFIYEPMFTLNEQVQPEPVLAKDCIMSSDGRSAVVNLRDDVKWHNGDGFDAYDAAYTIRCIKENETAYANMLEDIASWKAIDQYQLLVSFDRSIPNVAALLTFPVIKYNTPMDKDVTPIGTGPFAYSGKISTDRYMLNAFDYYYGEKSNLDGVYIDEAPDAEHYVYMYSSGAFDVATSKTLDLRTYTPRGSAVMNEYITDRLILLGINNEKIELQGLNTRLALSQLIDKEHIVSSILYSRAVQTDVPINPWFWLYDGRKSAEDGLSAEGHIRIDAWTDRDNGGYTRRLNGQRQYLDLDLLVNSENEEKVKIAQAIADNFNRYGVKTKLIKLPYEQYAARVESKQYDLFIGEYNLPPTQDMSVLLGNGNVFNYANENMQSLISQIGMTSEPEQLKELYGQFGEMFTAEMPFVPIAYVKECMMSSPKLKNIKAPGGAGFFRMPGVWSLK